MPRWRGGGRKASRRNWAASSRRARFAAASRAAAPVASGSRFGASLSAHGERLAEACVTLRKPVENGLSLLSRPTVLLRYFPRLAAGYQDKPAVNELTMSITDNLTVAQAWVGEAELKLPEANGEELHALAPRRVEFGFPLLAFLLGHRSEDPGGSHPQVTEQRFPPSRRSGPPLASPRGSPRFPSRGDPRRGETFAHQGEQL